MWYDFEAAFESKKSEAERAHKRVDNLRFSTLLRISPFPFGTAKLAELRL